MPRTKDQARKSKTERTFKFNSLPADIQKKVINYYLNALPRAQKITIQTSRLGNEGSFRPPKETPNATAHSFLQKVGLSMADVEAGLNLGNRKSRQYRTRITAPKNVQAPTAKRSMIETIGPWTDAIPGNAWGGSKYNLTWNKPIGQTVSINRSKNVRPSVFYTYMKRPPLVTNFPKFVLLRNGQVMNGTNLANGATKIRFRTRTRYNDIHTPSTVSKQFRNHVKSKLMR